MEQGPWTVQASSILKETVTSGAVTYYYNGDDNIPVAKKTKNGRSILVVTSDSEDTSTGRLVAYVYQAQPIRRLFKAADNLNR